MTGFIMFLHALAVLMLIVVILMQSGRGGGLTEAFASAESMFGAKTNELLIKGTTVLACLFFITSLTLAVVSAQKGKSLMTPTAADMVQKEEAAAKAEVEKALGGIEKSVETSAEAVKSGAEAPVVPVSK